MCDCAYRVHLGIRCGGSGCHCHDEENSITIPVKFEGFVIGTATITDSTITATFDKSTVAKEIREDLLYGFADSITIRPNLIPAKKKE
jgi:hypothetical protein